MATEILVNAAQTIVGKAIDWIWTKVTSRSPLRFLDPEIIYCYSFYDEGGNHVHKNGRKMIYSVFCSVTIVNSAARPQPMTHISLSAIVGEERHSMNLFDRQDEKWFSTYTVPGDSAQRTAWSAFIAGHGIAPGSSGMIPIEPVDAAILFELAYRDKRGKKRRCTIRLSQARIINPRFIGVN